MGIKIVKPFDSQHIKETSTRWKLAAKKNFRDIGLYLLVFGLYFLIGINKYNKTGFFWSFWTSVGIAFFVVALILSYGLYKGRKKWMLAATTCIEKAKKSNVPTEYIFSNDKITIRDSESYAEFNWTVFSGYKIYKTYLLVYMSNSDSVGISIDTNSITEKELSELQVLIKAHLAEMK